MYPKVSPTSRNHTRNSAPTLGSGGGGSARAAAAALPVSAAPWPARRDRLLVVGPALMAAVFAAPEQADAVPAVRALAAALDGLGAEGRLPLNGVLDRRCVAPDAAAGAFVAGAWAAAVARQLGWPPAARRDAIIAALLHDVGAVLVPEAAGAAAHDIHPALGADLLGGAEVLGPAVDAAIRQHHERFDGGGTPHALAGEAIEPGARLLAAVDAIWPPGRAFLGGRGSDLAARLEALGLAPHLDPQVLDALVAVACRSDDRW